MAPRTPRGKRVQSICLGVSYLTGPAGSELSLAADSFTFTDDIRVIGAEIELEIAVTDAQLNADGRVNCHAEVSKNGLNMRPGRIIHAGNMAGWTAAILLGGDMRDSQRVMFPDGHGMDFDEGESVYLHHYMEIVGAVDGHSFVEATVYFVER